jgi:hypothetical protein
MLVPLDDDEYAAAAGTCTTATGRYDPSATSNK